MSSDDSFEIEESLKDDLVEFFSEPSKENLPRLLRQDKEYDYLEFKREWPHKSKLAKHILAFSNSGGGIIVVGVDEDDNGTPEPVGVEDSWDEAKFGNKVENFIPDAAREFYALRQYTYSSSIYEDDVAGFTFQVVLIEGADSSGPLVATGSSTHIDEGAIYVRRNSKSENANYDELQSILHRRDENGVEKSTAELHEEMEELKTLYGQISKKKRVIKNNFFIMDMVGFSSTKKNKNYPSQTYDEYVRELIDKKKIKIERRLGVSGLDI
ncbi:helix-turn-helix domain-containing protein [Halomarina salina]|uniref:Helix-turn-helix domain-containing protein n=1 Tax=Halomarina salina TaxID=1872699 RepID=A0ABD5RQ64_9EURY|nr:ATP-binding protein [Halomarina salina]